MFLPIRGHRGTLVIDLIVASFSEYLVLQNACQKVLLKGREPKQLAEIHANVEDQLPISVFTEVWSKVGEAFAIDPRLIKPEDTLKAFSGIDSWDLGKGDDVLSQWIEEQHLEAVAKLNQTNGLRKFQQIREQAKERNASCGTASFS